MRLILLFIFSFSTLDALVEFAIISPSYNNEKYCTKHLESLRIQTYQHWHLYYTNDSSQDRTGLLVESYIRTNNLSNTCTIVHNTKRKGAMANIYAMVHKVSKNKVIVHLDGDDALAHPGVLETLAKMYENPNVWASYGNYKIHPNDVPSECRAFPEHVLKNNSFRFFHWSASHVKTYYAALFHKIRKEDLMYKNKFVHVASDVCFMMPICEMASKGHIRFIPEILYIYNAENPLNDDATRRAEVVEVDKAIRAKKRYKPLKKLF